jgi:hypothetical protein
MGILRRCRSLPDSRRPVTRIILVRMHCSAVPLRFEFAPFFAANDPRFELREDEFHDGSSFSAGSGLA